MPRRPQPHPSLGETPHSTSDNTPHPPHSTSDETPHPPHLTSAGKRGATSQLRPPTTRSARQANQPHSNESDQLIEGVSSLRRSSVSSDRSSSHSTRLPSPLTSSKKQLNSPLSHNPPHAPPITSLTLSKARLNKKTEPRFSQRLRELEIDVDRIVHDDSQPDSTYGPHPPHSDDSVDDESLPPSSTNLTQLDKPRFNWGVRFTFQQAAHPQNDGEFR
eukprot:GHVN01051757.1.p1 GENE.GHVN01051757.1~~GHVN01051757.1.p1  ORF type:complete len:218 (+),score=95.46 GHVN01051757.1:307-960(+)